jgi:hypothetical protein
MGLELRRFAVSVARDGLDLDKAIEAGEGSGYDTHKVTILHADQLVAEQAGPRYGLTDMKAAPMAYATLWTWAALKRTGAEPPEFPLFKGRVIALEKITDTPEAGDLVDPTRPSPGTG